MLEFLLRKLDNILIIITRTINKFHLYLANQFDLHKSDYKFLTPNDNAKDIKKYSDALIDALCNKKVKNIAVSGSYGAGKSSFIKTFEKHNSQYKFLDISLATFGKENNASIEAKEEDKNIDLSLIEKSILEQLFYKVKNTKIPQSRLKKINRLRWLPFKIIAIIVFAISSIVIFKPSLINDIAFFGIKFKDILTSNITLDIAVILFLVGLFFIIKKLFIVLSNTNIDKLTLKSLELVPNNDSPSLLNKYLDEILYFFEKTDYDVVVFQDLDRFGNLEIFTRLRELNNFINNSDQVNKRLIFIYAVKDEMFKTATERTKFFDFLIPIVPFVNATNSKDILVEYFKEESINKAFLYDISLYISDMRLIRNIYNEYMIYSRKIGSNLDKTKLLAMIVYKNFVPEDFSQLHECKGIVYDVFNTKKNNIIEAKIGDIKKEIDALKEESTEIEKETCKDAEELKSLYIYKLAEMFGGNFQGRISVDNTQYTFSNLITDNNFEKIKLARNIKVNNYLGSQTFSNIEETLGKYDDRLKVVENKAANKTNQIQLQIKRLEEDIQKLKNSSLTEIFINHSNIDIFAGKDNEFSNEIKQLISYLLMSGYIDESYEDYISNFFNTSITRKELDFLRNVKGNGNALDFKYELVNLDEIINHRLLATDYIKQSILNIHLVEHLLSKEKDITEVSNLFKLLSNNSKVSNDFILSYLDEVDDKSKFIKLICEHYDAFWILVSENRQEKLNEIFELVINNVELEKIIDLNKNDILKEYISNLESLSKSMDIEKFNKLIENLEVKFIKLDLEDNKKALDIIYENSYYELNPHMVNQIVLKRYSSKSIRDSDLNECNYTTIVMCAEDNILTSYIDKNINDYVNNIILAINTNTKELPNYIVNLLNNDDLDQNFKVDIIRKQEAKVSNLNDVNNVDLYEYLFEYNKIEASWDNIFIYFNTEDFNQDVLFEYLNIEENAKLISKIRCDSEYKEKNQLFTQELLKLIIKENSIANICYEYLIKSLGWCYSDLDISELDNEKVLLLIKHKIFSFNQSNFDLLKAKDIELSIEFLCKNNNKLIGKCDEFEFDVDDFINILSGDFISSEDKTKIVEENLEADLIDNNKIAKLVNKYSDNSSEKSISYIKNMIQNLTDTGSKIDFLIKQNEYINDSNFIEIFKLLPDEYASIIDNEKSHIAKNELNLELFDILKKRNVVDNKRSKIYKQKGYISLHRS